MAYIFPDWVIIRSCPKPDWIPPIFFNPKSRRRSVSSRRSLHPWDHGPHHPHGTPGGFPSRGLAVEDDPPVNNLENPPRHVFSEVHTMKIVDFPASYVGLQECKVFFSVFFERTHRNAELSKHLINHDLIFNLIFLILIYYTCTCFFFGGSIPYPSVKEFVYV